jgi:hypothetical protein
VEKFGQTFNLEKDKFHIFLAVGSMRGGSMAKHREEGIGSISAKTTKNVVLLNAVEHESYFTRKSYVTYLYVKQNLSFSRFNFA